MHAFLRLPAHLVKIADARAGFFCARVFAMPKANGNLVTFPPQRNNVGNLSFAFAVAVEDDVPCAEFALENALKRMMLD